MADPLTSADIQRITDNVNDVNAWAEGDETTSVVLGGQSVDSPSKVIADSRMFKAAIAWPASTLITDATQSYLYLDVIYIPRIDLLPFTSGALFTASNWQLLNSVPDGLVGNLEGPLTRFPFKKNLLTEQGESEITFTRATTGRYVDRYGRIQEAAIDTPRFEKQGLLMEGESENLALYSEDLTHATWVNILTPVVTANAGVAPDGTTTADEITDNDAANREGLFQNIVVADDTATYSVSVYFKEVTSDQGARLEVLFSGGINTSGAIDFDPTDLSLSPSGNAYIASQVEVLADGWYRLKMQVKNNGIGNTTLRLKLFYGNEESMVGSGLFWGSQTELLDMVTSYIPTTAVSVTRNSDNAVMFADGISPAWNRSVLDGFSYVFTFDILREIFTGLPAERMTFFAHSAAALYSGALLSPSGELQYQRAGVGSSVINPEINTEYRIVVVVDSNELVSVYVDDILEVQETKNINTDGELPTSMFIGSVTGLNTSMLFGHIKDFRIYDKALSYEEIRAL